MPHLDFGGVLLNLIRFSIFVFFAWAVVDLVRTRQWRVARVWESLILVGALFVTDAVGAVGRGVVTGGGQGVAYAALSLSVSLVVCAIIGVVCYAGLLLAGERGGYWRRLPSGEGSGWVVMAGVALMALIAGYFLALAKLNGASMRPGVPGWQELLQRVPMGLSYAIGEEVFYRGWVQARLSRAFGDGGRGTVLAIMVAAVVFAAQHPITAPGGLVAGFIGGILLGGVGFGWLFSRYGLLAAIVVHFAVNLMMIFLPLKTG